MRCPGKQNIQLLRRKLGDVLVPEPLGRNDSANLQRPSRPRFVLAPEFVQHLGRSRAKRSVCHELPFFEVIPRLKSPIEVVIKLGSRLGILIGFRPLPITSKEEPSRTCRSVAAAIPASTHGRGVNEVSVLQFEHSRDIPFEIITRRGEIVFTMLRLVPFPPSRIQQIRHSNKCLLSASENTANIPSCRHNSSPYVDENSLYPVIL